MPGKVWNEISYPFPNKNLKEELKNSNEENIQLSEQNESLHNENYPWEMTY